MKTFLALLLTVACCTAGRAAPKDPSAADDILDVIYLKDGRLLLLRMHVFMDGQPVVKYWNDYMEEWFRYLDRNKDEAISQIEMDLVPGVQFLVQAFRGYVYAPASLASPGLADLDQDKDEKVTLAEFIDYYRTSPAGPIQFTPAPQFGQNNLLTGQLFTTLDADRDGKLSEAEAKQALAKVERFDINDDEIVVSSELLPAGGIQNFGLGQGNMMMGMQGQAADSAVPLMLVPRELKANSLTARLSFARQLLRRFDLNEDNKLKKVEVHMPAKTFAELDRNKDEALDPLELLGWMITRPDIELTLRLGKRQPDEKPLEVLTQNADPALALKQNADDLTTFLVGNSQISLSSPALPSRMVVQVQQTRRAYEQQFRTADSRKRGVVTAQQLQDRQFTALRAIARFADRNGDGDLEEKELNEWLNVVDGGENRTINLLWADRGAGLFDILDANKDGRLSRRELLNAWGSLAPFDVAKQGAITKDNIPTQVEVSVLQGSGAYYTQGRIVINQGAYRQPGAVRQAPARGPTWFTRMDRNGDGDVSRREFLGTPDQFDPLDLNRDDVVSPEEAEAADKRLRK
jgi:Ca2+-binding EF-hand superfamily protein